MVGRGSKSSLLYLLDDLRLEEFQESSDLLADDQLPTQSPTPLGFISWIETVVHEVDPRFVLDEATLLMAEEIERAINGRAARLLLVPAPRSGKSLLMCLGFVYSLMKFPDRPQILISASQRLAQNHSKKILAIFKAAGGRLHPKSKSVQEWMPGWRNGGTQAVIGRSTSCLGLGAAMVWIDDPVGSRADAMSPNVMDAVLESYGSDWISRLQRDAAGLGESLVLVNQRLSSTDLAGQIINRAKASRGGASWRVVHIPIVFPEDQALALNSYPDHWQILQLQGKAGEPTSSRVDLKTVEERRAAMSPAAFKALFLGDVSDDSELCPFKDSYLRELPTADLQPGAICLALDLAITGTHDGHGYAVVASGLYECRGKAIVLEAGELQGAVDVITPQIVELVRRFEVSTVAVERAGGGHFLLRDLNAGLANFGVNVEAISHGGRSKWSRLEAVLGSMSLGQVLVPTAAPWLPNLRTQLKAIATRQDKARDDVADATLYGLEVVGRWIRGGFTATETEWSRAGFLEKQGSLATWSYGNRASATGMGKGRYQTDPQKPFPGFQVF